MTERHVPLGRARRMHRTRWAVLAAIYAVGLALVVLGPVAGRLNRLTVRLYVLWVYDLHLPGSPLPEDFGTALNVVLFVPVGFLLVRLSRLPWWACALLCVLGSSAIEGAQRWVLTGRDASLGDVVANGCGGVLGAATAALLTHRAERRRAASG